MTGSTVAVEQSTRLVATAAGRIWTSSDFAREPGFNRMVDRLAKAVGYRTGCAVPIMWGGRPVGAILLSSTQKRRSWDAVTADLSAAAPMLAVALRLDRGLERSRLRVLVVHPDTLVGRGLARIVERGLNADVRLVHGHLDPQFRGSNGWADIVVADAGSAQRPSVCLMVAVGQGAVTAVALAAADDPASQAAARTAGATAVIGRHWAPEQIVATIAQAVTL